MLLLGVNKELRNAIFVSGWMATTSIRNAESAQRRPSEILTCRYTVYCNVFDAELCLLIAITRHP